MHRSTTEAEAAERARWLAELAVAIDEAQRLAWQLGVAQADSADAKDLYGRLESLRAEVDSLRLDGWATCREEIKPSWISLTPWTTTFRKSV